MKAVCLYDSFSDYKMKLYRVKANHLLIVTHMYTDMKCFVTYSVNASDKGLFF